jgi:uncharacterized protein YkwD
MLKRVKNYFYPCQDNNFHPHFYRKTSVLAMLILVILLFILSLTQTALLRNSKYLATVLPATLVDFANDTREIYSLGDLKYDSKLELAAELKAEDMVSKSYFAHNSPEGISPWYWFSQAGYEFIFAGENLAINFSDSRDVHNAWLASASHRANILNANFTSVGIATAEGMYQGVPATFVVQMFGRPLVKDTEIGISVAHAEEVFVNTEPALELSPVVKTDTFISVAREEIEGNLKKFVIGSRVAEEVPVLTPTDTLGTAQYSGFTDELYSSPKTLLGYSYLFLSLVILLVIVVSLWSGAREHRHKHVGSTVFLLLLITSLVYAYDFFIISDVVVI